MKEPVFSFQSPMGRTLSLYKTVWRGRKNDEMVSIVNGMQGNQLNGLLLITRLSRFLQAVADGREEGFRITGTIQLFPVANALAFEEGASLSSLDSLDLDLVFPGNEEGEMVDRLCNAIYRHTAESTYGIVVQSPASLYEDYPHAKLYCPGRHSRNLARYLGLDVVREINESPTLYLKLFYQWVDLEMDAFAVSFGSCGEMRPELCDPLFSHLVEFLLAVGVLDHKSQRGRKAKSVFYGLESEVNVFGARPGLFVPRVQVGASLKAGQKLGEVQDVFTGECVEELVAPEEGLLVSLRRYPVLYEGECVATILAERKRRWALFP